MGIRSVKRLKNSPADREGAEMKNLLNILWRQQEGQDLTERCYWPYWRLALSRVLERWQK